MPFLLAISNSMDSRNYIAGYTLVDITDTGVTRDRGTQELERNQQRNWETVIQCISLRAQPMGLIQQVTDHNLEDYEFGEMYTGNHRVWSFAFTVEHESVFRHLDNPLYYLDESFDKVPVITYLSETAKFMLPIFWTSGAIKNIYFKICSFDLNK